jgi:hypothetical protein
VSQPATQFQPPAAELAETDPVAFTRQYAGFWLAEANAVRPFTMPNLAEGPTAFSAALIQCRGQLDRLEELMRSAKSLHGGLRRRAAELKAAADDAWDQAARNEQRRGARSGDDYESARERSARFNLVNFEERRIARQFGLAADMASDAADRLHDMHMGLATTRADLTTILRAFVPESSLDR